MTTEEIKQQAHKEFEDVIEHLPTLDNSRNLNNKWKKKFLFLIDSLIDKTVQITEDRIVGKITPPEKWKQCLKSFDGQDEICSLCGFNPEKLISLITNKSDINNLTE